MSKRRKPASQTANLDGEPSSKRARSDDESEEETEQRQRRAGTVSHMILKNFMCHSLLEVDFTSNVSVVIGKNGSGKSAILTALIVGLGGKATLTNRGTNLKGFIKAGKNSASIEIRLLNEGAMAYKPKVYGKTITVIRNLTASGGNSYRIKSASGEVIANQAKEVQNITLCLNIQVDNPICILNQDTSRNFLSSNDPKHKFSLFMKATRLDVIQEEYKKGLMNKRDSATTLSEKEATCKNVQDELKKIKRKIDGKGLVLNLTNRRQLLMCEMLWAKVKRSENEMQEQERKVETCRETLERLKDGSNSREEKLTEIAENLKILDQKMKEIKEEITIQSRPQLDMRRILDELHEQFSRKKVERQQIRTNIASKIRDAEYLEKEIANANEKLSRVEQEKMKRVRTLTGLEEKIKSMEEHLQTSRNDLFQIKSDISRKEEDENTLRREIVGIDDKIRNENRSLQAIQQESGNKLFLYGRDMPRVKQMIQQMRNQFTHEPRGPLGDYIKLRDKKWAVAVEGYLSAGLLNTFTVDNNKDNELLRKIFNKVWTDGRQPNIITSRFIFEKHDVSNNLVRAPRDCLCLYDAIEIEDPVVSNCIVDQAGVEGILLIPNDVRAQELLSQEAHVPRNCTQGVTIKGDKYYPDPNYKTYGSRYHRAKFLQVDAKEHIMLLQQNIETYERNKQNVQAQLEAIRRNTQEQIGVKNELENKIGKLNAAKRRIREELENVKATAEPELANVNILESELDDIKTNLTRKNVELEKLMNEMKEIKQTIVENEEKMIKLKEATRNLEERIEPLNEQIREYRTQQQELSTNDSFDKRRKIECERKLREEQVQLVTLQNIVVKRCESAEKVGERLETIRLEPEITEELSEIEKSIAQIERETDISPDIERRYRELSNKYASVLTIMETLRISMDELTSGLNRRNRYYKLVESYFITFMRHSFKRILAFRQFKGNLEINTETKTLELIVIPQQGSQGLTKTSNLSGGERSFSTVAFLYALWQCMEFPFYFLDEFDVYMDKLNRSKVFEILLHHAEEHPELQFVFLTPQDVSFIKKDVCFLRLEDPERHQE